jgi:hypothetical protein
MWEDNIKVNLRGIGWGAKDWIQLAHNINQRRALVNTVMNFRVPRNVGKFLVRRETTGFSRRIQYSVVRKLGHTTTTDVAYIFIKTRRILFL